MANVDKAKRKEVTVTLSGTEYPLRYTLNSFAEMEDKYGTVDKALQAMEKGSIKAVRFVLWAGLVNDHPELTEVKVGSLIEIQDIENLSEKMSSVMDSDLPDKGAATNPEGLNDPNAASKVVPIPTAFK